MRIAVVAPAYYDLPPREYGGTERVCFALAEALVELGHEVTLIGVGTSPTQAGFVATSDVAPTEDVDDPAGVELLHALRARQVIARMTPDVVHEHTRLGLLTSDASGPPTVTTVHAALTGPESQATLLRAAGPTVRLTAISRAQRADAPDLPWVATVLNGILLRDHPHVRRSADYALYLGRLSRTKGVELAVHAARQAGLPLVIAGDWTSPAEQVWVEDELRPLLASAAAGEVIWVGPVDDAAKRDLFARAGCLVLPARWREPFGLVVVESMASGVPVVALRAGAIPELVDDGRTGILCDDVADMPAALTAAMRMDGASCRPWVQQHFSAERMAAEYVQVYRSLGAG